MSPRMSRGDGCWCASDHTIPALPPALHLRWAGLLAQGLAHCGRLQPRLGRAAHQPLLRVRGAGDPAADGPLQSGAGGVAGRCCHGTDLIGSAVDGGTPSITFIVEFTVGRVPADSRVMQGLHADAYKRCRPVVTSGSSPPGKRP